MWGSSPGTSDGPSERGLVAPARDFSWSNAPKSCYCTPPGDREAATKNKCLARSNKFRTRTETTKKRRRQRDAIPLAARCVGQRCRSHASSPAEYARVRWNSSQSLLSGRFAVPDLPLLPCDDAPVAYRAQAERRAHRHPFLRVRPLRLRYFGRHLALRCSRSRRTAVLAGFFDLSGRDQFSFTRWRTFTNLCRAKTSTAHRVASN